MTYEEAKETLEYMISGDCAESAMEYVDEIEMAIEALEKQIPKKLGYKTYFGIFGVHKVAVCPCCNDSWNPDVLGDNNKYCSECGQAIDWSDIEC